MTAASEAMVDKLSLDLDLAFLVCGLEVGALDVVDRSGEGLTMTSAFALAWICSSSSGGL